MTIDEAIRILTEHNKWRRGLPPYDTGQDITGYTVKELGQAIDYAIEELHRSKGATNKESDPFDDFVVGIDSN